LGLLYLFLQTWSVFTTSLELTLSKIRDKRKPRHRLASLGNPKEKCPFLFRKKSVARKSEMQGTFFFGVLPFKYSGSVAGFQCGRGKAKLFLREEMICFASALFSKRRGFCIRHAGGCGRNAWRILFGFLNGGCKEKKFI